MRGAGRSGGSTSWTGLPESKDLLGLIDAIVDGTLFKNSNSKSPLQSSQIKTLYLCGYSYGSVIAASVSPSRHTQIVTHYILISYPKSVMWFLFTTRKKYHLESLSNLVSLKYQTRVYKLVDKFKSIDPSVGIKTLGEAKNFSKILFIIGEKDQFTSSRSYQAMFDDFHISETKPLPLESQSQLSPYIDINSFNLETVHLTENLLYSHHQGIYNSVFIANNSSADHFWLKQEESLKFIILNWLNIIQ